MKLLADYSSFERWSGACAGCAEDAVVLERLSACLQLFQGVHPFHNYTVSLLCNQPHSSLISYHRLICLWNKTPVQGGHCSLHPCPPIGKRPGNAVTQSSCRQ